MLNTKLKFYSLLATIAILLFIASFYGNKIINERHFLASKLQVQSSLNKIQQQLSVNINNDIQALKTIPLLFSFNYSLTQQQYSSAIAQLFDTTTRLSNITVAPDLIVKYIYPLAGNEAMINRDYRPLPIELASINTVENIDEFKLIGPIRLPKGEAFIYQLPIFINKSDNKAKLWGVISAVLDSERLYKDSGMLNADLAIDLAIRRIDKSLSGEEIFYGSVEIFDSFGLKASIEIANGQWQLAARPKGGWHRSAQLQRQQHYLSVVLLIIFIVLSTTLWHLRQAMQAGIKCRNILASSPIPYALNNKYQQLTYLNPAFIATYGYDLVDITEIADWWLKAYPVADYRKQIKIRWDEYFIQRQKKVKLLPLEVTISCKDGSVRTALLSLSESNLISKDEYLLALYDITERKLAEQALKASETKFHAVFDSSSDAIMIVDDSQCIEVNKAALDLFSCQDKRALCDKSLADLSPSLQPGGDYSLTLLEQWSAVVLEQGSCNFDWQFKCVGSESVFMADVQFSMLLLEDKSLIQVRIHDISEQKKQKELLQLSSRVFTASHEGIMVTDADKIIVDVNPAFSEITGYQREDAIGQTPTLLTSGKQSSEFYNKMWQEINDKGHWQGELWNSNKFGQYYAELLTISTLVDDDNNIVNYVGIFSDITEKKLQQEKLNLMARYDPLTQLPNRALFADRFAQAIAHSKRSQSQLAICFVDLDKFKAINDNFGHDIGDKLLQQVAERIKQLIRQRDTVSRQGGDEFIILLGELESFTQCDQAMKRLHRSLAQPYLIDGISHIVTASSGVTIYPDDDSDLDTLVRHADQAMYESKQLGRNRYQLFNAKHDQQRVHLSHRLDEIEKALNNDEFGLYYQAKINMATGKVFGVEGLIRWIHPENGLILPLAFLPVIDNTQLEIDLGNYLLNKAVMQLDSWRKQGLKLEVSINISSKHLLSDSFIFELEATFAKYPEVESKYLQLEILESSALADLDAIRRVIKGCKKVFDISIALDDFGTAYSSLNHLRNLPVQTIKIDQSFVKEMIDEPSDYAIVNSIIGLADAFDRKVIAEGVDSTEQGLMLLILGCEQIQGIAKAMPADDFFQWLSLYTPNAQWLRYTNSPHTIQENKIMLFQLVSEQWRHNFVSNIQSPPSEVEYWPIFNVKHCPCGYWIKRAKQEYAFNQDDLNSLSKAHKEFHNSAHFLLLQYQDGDVTAARNGRDELEQAFEHMINVLVECQ